MKIGVGVPTYDQYADPRLVVETAKRAEALGFDAIWCIDHVVIPGYDTKRIGSRHFELLTTLSHLCAHVHRVQIGTDVLVTPYRHPVVAAKMLATLDVLSGGRLIIGAGTGYIEEEFGALDVPYADRGRYTDECIRVWKAVWSGGNAAFQGKYFSFEDMAVDPQPVQQPHPPIWFGNRGARVFRRVLELGDGWHPVGLSFAQLEEDIGQMKRLAAAMRRDSLPTLSYSGLFGTITEEPQDEALRIPLSGDQEQVLADIRKLAALGFTSIVLRFGAFDGAPDLVQRQMELFARTVLPKLP